MSRGAPPQDNRLRRPLLVSHTAAPGGSNTVLLALLTHLPAEVQPACIFLAEGDIAAQVRSLGIEVEVVPSGRAREAWRAPAVVRSLRRAARRHEADLIFAHTAKAQIYASLAGWLDGTPSLWWQHALPGQQPLLGGVADRLPTAAVICYSDFTAEMQRARTPHVPVHRVHGGTDPPPVERPRPSRSTGLRVGLVARLQRWKRVELLLRAVPLVLAAEPQTSFVVVGGGDPAFEADYPGELRALAGELGISDAVTFTGHVGDAGALIEDLDLLVHTAQREPFGLVYLEAMARRVAIVAPRSGGSAEIIRDEVDGLLVDVTDADQLAAAIVALLRDPARRQRMGAAGHERVREHFTVARMAQEAWRIAAEAAQQARAGRTRRGLRARP